MPVEMATTRTPGGTWLAASQSARTGTSAWQCGHQCATTTIAIGPWSGAIVMG